MSTSVFQVKVEHDDGDLFIIFVSTVLSAHKDEAGRRSLQLVFP